MRGQLKLTVIDTKGSVNKKSNNTIPHGSYYDEKE